MKKNLIVLQSPMSPDAVADALRRSMDDKRRALFSLSGYKGDQPVLGEIVGNTFHLQKRRYWRNDFAPHFYGEIQSDPRGTRIVGRFDLADEGSVKYARVAARGVALMTDLSTEHVNRGSSLHVRRSSSRIRASRSRRPKG
jgi:hypothetical protein